ncbi:hypothetical protein AAF712_005614 [Marasmius tenuissimus]|uniref:Uncharacterized protein n=1 Tax=Marasmius tenuissimus TaxID=585030 RepID=A0ABR3A1K4_9AGAR|nr:hypothetical protein PM082_000207 [Marasmius tenuissimus]
MKFTSTFASLSVLVTLVAGFAVPLKREGSVTDVDVLNFALTLEHLENTFYHDALAKFSEDHFEQAGYPDWVRGRFTEIAQHEQVHVDGITAAVKGMNGAPVEPCKYKFPYEDVDGFIDLGNAFETVGSSAYSGAASFVNQKPVLTVAATILAVEARHSSWIGSSVKNANPWSGSFEIALTPNQVFTIAATFIESCPSSNAPLPAKANPSLALSDPQPGEQTTLTFDASGASGSEMFLVLQTSDGPVSAAIANDKTATIPSNVRGTVFAFVSSKKDATDDASVLAGPALLMFPYQPAN